MVQRYSFERYNTTELTEPVLVDFVKYKDYEDLHAVLCLLIDQVNLCELPDSLCEKLEAMGLL